MSAIRVSLIAAAGLLIAGHLSHVHATAPPETTTIWRAQLTVQVCGGTGDETLDRVSVQMGTPTSFTTTALDHPQSDFTRSSVRTYDLIHFYPTGTQMTLGGLTQLKIATKMSTDGLRVCSLALTINGRQIFVQTYNPGQLISSTGLVFDKTALRSNIYWQVYGTPPAVPNSIAKDQMRALSQALIATKALPLVEGLRWSATNDYLNNPSVTRKNTNTLHVKAKLYVAYNYWDLDYDITFSCTSGTVRGSIANASFPTSFLGLIKVYGSIPDALNATTFLYKRDTTTCPFIYIDDFNNVAFI